ncbi:MAG: glycosyltransferase [Candidatus Marinamargulisbacteria bacterium]
MKVLIVTRNFPNKFSKHGGIFTFNRIKELLKQGIEVDVLLLNSCVSRKLGSRYLQKYNTKDLNLDNEVNVDVNVINFVNLPIFKDVFLSKAIQFYANKLKCDLVHFHFLWSVYGIKELAKINTPYVVTCHGSDIHQLPSKSQKEIKLNLWRLNHARHVIFVSNFLKDIAQSIGFISDNFSTIYNGINLNMFNYIKTGEKETNHVGYFGNLFPIKRVHLLPEIFKKVTQKIQCISFIIAGSGPELETLKKEVAQLKLNVTFLPKFEHKEFVENLKMMDVIVMPSKLEGFPCIPLEAKAMGVPTVGSNNGGVPEVIMGDGALIDDGPNMINDFAEAIVGLIKKPLNKDKMVEHAKQFSWENIIKDEINVYWDVLNRSTSGR